MKNTENKIIRLVPMTVIMGTIFFLSHQPGDSLYMPPILWFDKIAHMAVYAVLAVTVLYAFQPRLRHERAVRVILLTMGVCIFYGIGDEFHQSFIPGRFASIFDVAADTLGAAAVCAAWFLWKGRENRSQKTSPAVSPGPHLS